MQVKQSILWLLTKNLKYSYEIQTHEDWEGLWEEIAMSLNWGNHITKKHLLTTDEEWKIISGSYAEEYFTEETCKLVFDLLCEKRFELHVKAYE